MAARDPALEEGAVHPTLPEQVQALHACSHKAAVPSLPNVQQYTVPLLQDVVPSFKPASLPSPLRGVHWPPQPNFVGLDETLVTTAVLHQHADSKPHEVQMVPRAGPTETIMHDPCHAVAAIVTCGGLCPGLNTVIRELVMCLRYTYGVTSIFGIRNGYRGFYENEWEPLTPKEVSSIHKSGGTYLGSSRGGFDADRILDAVQAKGATQLYIVGGDGTHRGALALVEAAAQRGLPLSVAGIPKTIDCDIPLMQQTFGFATAVAASQTPIDCAHTEARSGKCVGIVKLMGRHAGFIALAASLASRDVNACLLPEAPWSAQAVNTWLEERLRLRDHALVVVAEGATCPEMEPTDGGKDASGNAILADVGEFLKASITAHFKSVGRDMPVKLIDPTYMIRAVPANAGDSNLCASLAVNAVHGIFAGRTGFTVGNVDGQAVLLPISAVASLPPRRVDVRGAQYTNLVLATGQPDFGPDATLESLKASAAASTMRKKVPGVQVAGVAC